jgi:hypothetical protein
MRLYRTVSLLLFFVFAIVGLLFLSIPEKILIFFNSISNFLGISIMPTQSFGFFPLLAVGYMYVVTLIALFMYIHPDDTRFPILLTHAKLATSILSLMMFFLHGRYLIYITNFIADGLIGIVVLCFYLRMKSRLSK